MYKVTIESIDDEDGKTVISRVMQRQEELEPAIYFAIRSCLPSRAAEDIVANLVEFADEFRGLGKSEWFSNVAKAVADQEDARGG